MTTAGICHPLAPHFGDAGRYQVSTHDPLNGQYVSRTDDLDEAVEVLWTHYQLERRHDTNAQAGIYDFVDWRYVVSWRGGQPANQPDLHPLDKLFLGLIAAAREGRGAPVLIIR